MSSFTLQPSTTQIPDEPENVYEVLQPLLVESHLQTSSSLNYRPPAPDAMLTTWIVHNIRGDPIPIRGDHGTISLT